MVKNTFRSFKIIKNQFRRNKKKAGSRRLGKLWSLRGGVFLMGDGGTPDHKRIG
jgi:hypothetical protein